MLETSKDFLFIILAFCALWLTIFLSWLMYYIIKIFRNTSRVIDRANETVNKVDDFIDSIKARLEKSTSHLVLLGELVRKGMDFMEKRKEKYSTDESEAQAKRKYSKRK